MMASPPASPSLEERRKKLSEEQAAYEEGLQIKAEVERRIQKLRQSQRDVLAGQTPVDSDTSMSPRSLKMYQSAAGEQGTAEDAAAREQLKESLAQSLARERELFRMKTEIQDYMAALESATLESFEQRELEAPSPTASGSSSSMSQNTRTSLVPSQEASSAGTRAVTTGTPSTGLRLKDLNPLTALITSLSELGGADSACFCAKPKKSTG